MTLTARIHEHQRPGLNHLRVQQRMSLELAVLAAVLGSLRVAGCVEIGRWACAVSSNAFGRAVLHSMSTAGGKWTSLRPRGSDQIRGLKAGSGCCTARQGTSLSCGKVRKRTYHIPAGAPLQQQDA